MRWGTRAMHAYSLVFGAGAIAYFSLPESWTTVGIWIALSFSASIAIVWSLRRHRPERPLPWLLFAGGLASFAVGNVIFYGYEAWLRQEIALPSLADPFFLAMYPLLAGGLLVLVRRRTPTGDRAALLDAVIVALGLGLVSWVFIVMPYLDDTALTWLARVTAIAYPICDILVIAMIGRLWGDRGERGPSFRFLAAGLLPLLIVDTLYAMRQLEGTFVMGSVLDAGWLAFYYFFGMAALHPSMRELDQAAPMSGAKVTRVRFALLLMLSSLLMPAMIVNQRAWGIRLPALLIGLGSLVLCALVLVRVDGLLRAFRELHRRQSEGRFQRLTQHSSDMITVCDTDGVVRYQTPSVERLFGWAPATMIGQPLLDWVAAEDGPRVRALLDTLDEDQDRAPFECRIRRPDGGWVLAETVATRFDDDGMRGYLLTTRDVTERRDLEDQLVHQAFHDSLTGLANRSLFVERVRHALERRTGRLHPLAVLMVDLDDFQTVNDSLGHASGDGLLRGVADRLRECLRAADTAARLGGDEFALLLEEAGEPTEAAAVAERVLAMLQQPFTVDGREVVVRASVGIALPDPDSVTGAEELIRNADVAMHTAKRHGKDRFDFYAPSMHAGLIHKLDMTVELRAALERAELTVFYQPIVLLPEGRIKGFEALVRWMHPVRGMVSPAEFVPLAEETGLIVPVGDLVLRTACQQLALWRSDHPELTMSVNLSPRQVQDPGIVAAVAAVLAETGLPPHLLTLEITESVLTEDSPVAVQRLDQLKALGVRLAVDDFGTGYSSLSRLRDMPIDQLKIPKPFVDGVTAGPKASALARAIVDLSSTLDLAVVAEGIEHPEQAAVLAAMGCGLGQGFHFARPAPAAEIGQMLAAVPA